MNLEGSRKFVVMWLAVLTTWALAKFGPEWGGIFATSQVILVPMLAGGVYMLFNYLQKTTADTFVPENWLAGKRTMIGLILAIIAPLIAGWSTEAKDAVTQTLTLVAEAGTPILFMVFQSLSDKKLKANPAPVVIPSVTFTAPATTTAAAPVIIVNEAAPISQVKDRIASAVKLINKDTKWDFLMGIWVDKIEAAKADIYRHNPDMTEADVNRLLNQYSNGVLNEADCKNVQSVMGLPAVLKAKNDVLILQSMQAAEKAGTLGPAQSDAYLKSAIKGVSMDILNEAYLRVQNDSLPIEARKLAMQEFGISKATADRAVFSGGGALIILNGSYTDFNPYRLVGLDVGI